jgi:hypothetical protein
MAPTATSRIYPRSSSSGSILFSADPYRQKGGPPNHGLCFSETMTTRLSTERKTQQAMIPSYHPALQQSRKFASLFVGLLSVMVVAEAINDEIDWDVSTPCFMLHNCSFHRIYSFAPQ